MLSISKTWQRELPNQRRGLGCFSNVYLLFDWRSVEDVNKNDYKESVSKIRSMWILMLSKRSWNKQI